MSRRQAPVAGEDASAVAPAIFISYRYRDTGSEALALAVALEQLFGPGSVFLDRSRLDPGSYFGTEIADALRTATVLLAVIGPGWNAPTSGGRSELQEENDWVREELAHALKSGHLVLPVLVRGARVPDEEGLPMLVRRIARLTPFHLSAGRLGEDAQRLAAVLARRLEQAAQED